MKILVDVRSKEEFEMTRAEGALNIPLQDMLLEKMDLFKEIDKNTTIELYCHSGIRSEVAKDLLLAKGFKNVKNLGGLREVLN